MSLEAVEELDLTFESVIEYFTMELGEEPTLVGWCTYHMDDDMQLQWVVRKFDLPELDINYQLQFIVKLCCRRETIVFDHQFESLEDVVLTFINFRETYSFSKLNSTYVPIDMFDKYVRHVDDVLRVCGHKKDDCVVCLEPTYSVTPCKHYLCIICMHKMECESMCPVCRQKLW